VARTSTANPSSRSSVSRPIFPRLLQSASLLLAGLCLLIFWPGPAGAFSVDVENLYYKDPSREIDYDFSAAREPEGMPPTNTIEIPEAAVIVKHENDHLFSFAGLLGTVTLELDTNGQVGGLQTTSQGGAVLAGSSPMGVLPPEPSDSWVHDVILKNFGGVSEEGVEYDFSIGMTAQADVGVQPRFKGVWDAGGRLRLTAQVYDSDTDSIEWSATPVVIDDLTPGEATVQLRIENNVDSSGRVDYLYRVNDGSMASAGRVAIPAGTSFMSLPALFPYVSLSTGAEGGSNGGSSLVLTTTGHPPAGFIFETGRIVEAAGDFLITGYQGNQPPYSAYGFLGEGVGVQDLGFGTIDETTEIPAAGYETPDSLLLTEGNVYAFSLPGGSFGLIHVRSVTPSSDSGSLEVTMTFDYLYRSGEAEAPAKPPLDHAVRALRVTAGLETDVTGIRDVNSDGRIGTAEALYVLQAVADLRDPLPPVESVSGSASLISRGWDAQVPFDGFKFSTGSVVGMEEGDFIVEWNIIFLGQGVSALDLGTVPLAQVNEVPTSGYGDEDDLPFELEDRTIAFKLADGTYAVIQFTEFAVDQGDDTLRSSFDYKYQPDGTPYF
jgi:hypothetical protein